jgi:membrane protein YqaA with SNARE-associated domain
MNKKRIVKGVFWAFNFLVIILFIYTLINYSILEKELSIAAQIGGAGLVAALVFILEGAPVFVGPSVAIASLLAMGEDPIFVLAIFLVFSTLGAIVYYYLGYFLGERVFVYFEKEDVKKYRELFKKYGMAAMLITAVTPIPYLPTVAGAFKMGAKEMFFLTTLLRIARHIIVFLFWFYVLV